MKEVIQVTARCPIRTALELVGGKWKLLIIFQLRNKPLRPSELRERIPDVSEKMLLQELKTLVENRLVSRKDYGEVPARVEYRLTVEGKKALPLIKALRDFAVQYEGQGNAAC